MTGKTIDRTEQVSRLSARLDGTYGEADGRLLLAVAPGRSEIAGNHTDHEGGHVIAGAVQKYTVGLFRPSGGRALRLASAGFAPVEVSLDDLAADPAEYGRTSALVRGLAALFAERGYTPRGFDAVAESDVPAGSGLSSSAAFELLVAAAMNALWAEGALAPIELAQMAQRAENEWFGKPCGLMDQATSSSRASTSTLRTPATGSAWWRSAPTTRQRRTTTPPCPVRCRRWPARSASPVWAI